jgi:pSer/pThr/pTyr-binding forkhead associated (FHA) protein
MIDTSRAITVGRKGRGVSPDLDLTPYGALEKGVSRVHAIIEVIDNTPIITDVGSTNGLYLNGMEIPTQKSRVLCDGDELHLGELVAHIYFE